MNMLKDKPWNRKSADVAMDDAKVEERKRFWVIGMIFLLSLGIFILVNAANDSVVVFVAHYLNRTMQSSLTMSRPPAKNWHNLLVDESSTYSSTLTKLLHFNATSDSECYHVKTNKTVLEGLPESVDGKFFFQTDMTHYLTLIAYEDNGMKRCAGGDYYEVDFHDQFNVIYKSRLPTVDFGNGSYGLELFVPSRFAGAFTLEIWLLFSNWHGMDYSLPFPWDDIPECADLVLTQELQMVVTGNSTINLIPHDEALDAKILTHDQALNYAKKLTQCTEADFDRTTWQGRWTRSWFNESCLHDDEKRFHCLPAEHYWCEEPWCFGPVGRLESNGWQYSAHCSFKIFQTEEAWKCLSGRWILVWGDSNGVDTIRNLLLFILGWNLPPGETLADFQLQRSFLTRFINPKNPDQQFQVTHLFNGHYEIDNNGLGMDTLRNPEQQQFLLNHFNSAQGPDTVIMNSAVHDGWHHATIESYIETVDFTIGWWMQLYDSIPADGKPRLVWRTSVVPAGDFRKLKANPDKLEMYNLVMVEKLQKVRDKFPVKIVDAFDLTFPFHFTHEYSDGGHYGRQPGSNSPPWTDGQAHWYFVELMLDHIFLNAICPLPA